MGKVYFPLSNIRKDVVSNWHMKHFTDSTSEEITVPLSADEYGYYTVFLTEVPDAGSSTKDITTTAPRIPGLVEFRGVPVDPQTHRLKITPAQYYVNYQTGQILFHPNQAGNTFQVDYWGKGSLVEADDVNNLHERINFLEKENDVPEFTKFSIVGFEKGILEVGESIPRDSRTSSTVEFIWETTFPTRIKNSSIQIENLLNNQKIGRNLSNNGQYLVDFQEIFTFNAPREMQFRISAEAINGSLLLKDFELLWVDRIIWGVSPHKNITGEQIMTFTQSKLFKNANSFQKEEISLLKAISYYKVIAVPRRYPITKVIDKETSLDFILDDPIELNVVNQFGLQIPYLVYCSTYPVTSSLNLILNMGETKNGN